MAQFVPVCFGQVTRTSGSVAVIWDLGAKIARTSLMAPELAVGSLVKFRMRRQSDLVITETGVCET